MSTPEHVIDQPSPAPRTTVDVVTAGFFERVAAAAIDLCVPFALGLMTFFLWPRPEVMEDSQWNAIDRFIDGYNVDHGLVWAPFIVVAMSAFGWNLIHGLRGRETPGRRVMKLKLIGQKGQPPTSREVMVHCLARIVSVLPVMLGHLWLLADPEKRTWHDRIARLYVVIHKPIGSKASVSTPASAPSESGPDTETASDLPQALEEPNA